MPTPTLLLTFNDTLTGRDQSGPVTPTANGTTAYDDGVVDRAYIAQQSTGSYLTIANDGYLGTDAGEIVVRAQNSSTFDSTSQYVFAVADGSNRLYLRRTQATSRLVGSYGALDNMQGSVIADDSPYVASLSYSGENGSLYVDDADTPAATIGSITFASVGTTIYLGRSPSASSQYTNGLIDDVMLFADPLTDEERAILFDPEAAWTWSMFASTAPRPSRVFVLGSPHNIGPLTPY